MIFGIDAFKLLQEKKKYKLFDLRNIKIKKFENCIENSGSKTKLVSAQE